MTDTDFDEQEETQSGGRSPVIGVILMVAITVILAGIMTSFVLGLNSSQEHRETPEVSFEQVGNPSDGNVVVSVTVESIGTANYITIQSSSGRVDYGTSYYKDTEDSNTKQDNLKASHHSGTVSSLAANETVIVLATFENKTTQIQTYTVK